MPANDDPLLRTERLTRFVGDRVLVDAASRCAGTTWWAAVVWNPGLMTGIALAGTPPVR